MRTKTTCLLLVLACLGSRVQAEVFFGGQNEFVLNVLFDAALVGDSSITGDNYFQLNIDAETENFSLALQSVLAYSFAGQAYRLYLNRILAVLECSAFLTIKAGKFHYSPGTAELSSNTDYFFASDMEKIITGELERSSLDNYLFQAGIFLENFYLNITAAPFHLVPKIPDFSSPWFPRKDLPAEIELTFPVAQVLKLANLFINTAETGANALQNISYGMEAGYSFPFLDISLLYYYGDDNDLLYKGEIDFPHGLFADYDIYLTPQVGRVTAAGLNVNALFAPFRCWLDASYSFGKSFMTRALSSENFETIDVLSDYFEYTAGISLDIEAPAIVLLLEYKQSHMPGSNPDIIEPFMSSLLSVMVMSRFWDSRLQVQGLYLYAPADNSMCAGCALLFLPANEMEIYLKAPFFFGDSNSLFGQFRDNHLASLGLKLKF